MLKRVIIIYGLLLVMIVVLADSGHASGLFSILAHVPFSDKLGHFILMGMMSSMLILVTDCKLVTHRGISFWQGPFWLASVVTLEEISQIWLNNRGFSLIDLAFDYLGIWVFAKAAIWLRARAHLASQRPSNSQ